MATVFTRDEFYELVWSNPITHLAKRFGLSDVAVHKICRKHAVPTPPPGWWAKQSAGKSVKRTPLPAAEGNGETKITIASAEFGAEPEPLREVREQARIIAAAAGSIPEAPMHPVVKQTLSALRKSKPSEKGIIVLSEPGLIAFQIAPASIERVGIALNRLAQAAQLHGFQLTATERGSHFKGVPESIGLTITEPYRRVKHVLTAKEQAAQTAWEKKRDRASRYNSWSTLGADWPHFPEWDYHPTGQLSFEFERVYSRTSQSTRSTFKDAKIQRVEEMAHDMAIGIVVLAAAKHEERLRREEEQRRIDEARRQREDAARRRFVRERREAALAAVLSDMEKLDRLRRLLDALQRSLSAGEAERTSSFVSWAQAYLHQMELGLSAKGLQDRFEAEHLFGDDDDHGFVPPSDYRAW